jgi:hypothetical protein
MSHKYAKVAIILAIIVVLAFAAPALGKGKPTTESTNNLSVPTIMLAGGSFTGVTVGVGTPSLLAPPTGTPLAGYPISPLDYYYVQGLNKWQGQAYSTTSALNATAAWGDNLSGDAKLKTNSPIRVELGLFHTLDAATDPVGSMEGYTVVKLDPAALDRESAYGTLATSDGAGGFFATPTTFTTVRVFDNAVTFSIQNVASGVYVVPPNSKASAEINATGNVVYGYNLRVSVAGDYLITYTTPSVTVTGSDAGTIADDGKSISLLITIAGGGGGGGGGHRP